MAHLTYSTTGEIIGGQGQATGREHDEIVAFYAILTKTRIALIRP
jgi:hypothetical protein